MTLHRFAPHALLALVALAVAAFGNGEHSHPVAAWLAPVLMLRFVRDTRTKRGLLAAWLVAALAWALQWHAVFRAEGLELAIGALLFGGLGLLPYLADRALARRLPPLAGTLVFPAALVAFELVLAHGPFGAWGMLAYTQADVLPLAQLASVTGMAGVTFLVAWLAPVANLAWQERAGTGWRAPAAAFAIAIVVAAGTGALRLALAQPRGEPLRVAIVQPRMEANANYDAALAPALVDGLFTDSEAAVARGAQLVLWPEDSFFVAQADAAALHGRAAAFAQATGAHLAIAYGERERADGLRYRNTSMGFAPDGSILWRYAKSHAVPGYEEKNMVPGDGRIASVATTFGRVAAMICFDADHGGMLAQLGGRHDLLVLPSDDWPAIAWLHAAMVRLHAIEHGVPVARPTINGRSVAFDAYGRAAGMLPPGSTGRLLLAELVPGSVAAPYVRVGDAFAWTCVALLPALLVLALRRRRAAGVAAAVA
ncbi:MAG TPA: nitrilase-related carbon-nitrogen hydrolase [Xanthomonadales bacterium]|nr:nitrilase-related carbon-nitrogen hydrolase [Xanthomonadales bacterium]